MLKGRFLSYLRKEFSSRITIYHNPQCGTSRNTLGLIRNSGIEPEVVEYLKYPLGRTKILEILEQMKLPIRHIVRKNTKPYEDFNLANESVSDSDILDAMVAHPILMNRPIVITERGIKLCRPSHSVLDILPISQQKPYILENCDIIGKDLRFRPKIVRAGSQKYAMIKVDQVDGIAIVTINRPNQRNAVDNTTAGELMDAFSSLDKDASVSAIVLTGAGQTFCAGYDLKSLAESSTHSSTSESNAPLGPFECSGHMGPTRYRMSKPVVAAVEGHAVAGGLELALWADIRIASSSAVFGVFCRRWGVPLIDGGTVRLPRLIGQSRAMDMILSGRSVDAQEALSWGLANSVVAEGKALSAAVEYAFNLSLFPQLCLQKDRDMVYRQWDLPTEEALKREGLEGSDPEVMRLAAQGASRFASGKGRGGDNFDI